MTRCPFCAEEIQEAAVLCKHCRSELGPSNAAPAARSAAPESRFPRLAVGLGLLAMLALLAPLVGRPIVTRFKEDRCQPVNWREWHVAMRERCLAPSYVCQHMTTSELLRDPDVAGAFPSGPDAEPRELSDLVGRMRRDFGCAPEERPAGQEPEAPAAPFPYAQDAPRTL